MKRLLVVLLFSLVGFAAAAATTFQTRIVRVPAPELHPAVKAMKFLLDRPLADSLRDELELWATWYHMPTVQASPTKPGAVPLLGLDGKAISPPLSVRDWCDAAMQGSVWVDDLDGRRTAYVFVDDAGPEQTDCDHQFGDLSAGIKSATRRARFAAFHHPQGCDVRPMPLLPFRTVAVDPKRFKMGTILFVPELRDHGFWMEGELYVHDGYDIASDRGGAIKGNHIDMFVASGGDAPFPDVISNFSGDTFTAYVVEKDDPAALALTASLDLACEEPRVAVDRGDGFNPV
ncbi:MAG: 3D domain-containing protein [Alphaproteobacteria bacterium]|nr:3D domain-containing protein [Alphaproteobacteria bacterium]